MTKIVDVFIYVFTFIFYYFFRTQLTFSLNIFLRGYHTSTQLKAMAPAARRAPPPRPPQGPAASAPRPGACAVAAPRGPRARAGASAEPGAFLSGFLLFLTVFLHSRQEPVSALGVLRMLSARINSLHENPALFVRDGAHRSLGDTARCSRVSREQRWVGGFLLEQRPLP